MEASEILQKAWTAVQDAGLPAELDEVAFREAIRLLSLQQPVPVPTAPGTASTRAKSAGPGDGSGPQSESGTATPVMEDQMYDEVVTQTGVDRSKLERLASHLMTVARASRWPASSSARAPPTRPARSPRS